MNRLLVSFTTRPGQGSEGGVGWTFLQKAVAWTSSRGDRLIVVIDRRDEDAVRTALPACQFEHVQLETVQLPGLVRKRVGDSRTRGSYLAWMPLARRRVSRIVRDSDIATAHQVTFATATLPHALPTGTGVRTVWGPLSVFPEAGTVGASRVPAMGARRIARSNAVGVDLIVANNTASFQFFEGGAVVLEPNIFLRPEELPLGATREYRALVCGLLTDRKRPWLAIQALARAPHEDLLLSFIGDGPLRRDLELLAEDLGVSSRVTFMGRLPRELVLEEMGRARCLIHPSAREGSPWVIGEAAAMGLPTVAFDGSGSETTVRESANGGVVVSADGDLAAELAIGLTRVLEGQQPPPSDRWSANRIPNLLDMWWQ